MPINPRVARSARVLLIACIALYGALLRVDAISHEFDPVAAPRWLHRLELSRNGPSVLRPAGMQWEAYPRFAHKDAAPSQYRSDPYTYLQYAREMRSFYAAHRREPLFPFATKVWLWLLHDNDSAVSFASAAFSVLAIVLTFALGAEAFSYWVGAAAALLWAIEFRVVTSASEGWRDDAFTCAVVLSAWLMLRFWKKATAWRAVALGAAAAAACLTRITSLSFIVPGLLYLLFALPGDRRTRAQRIATAVVTMAVLVGPFLFNSWRVFGDPLYAINVHADVYRATEGESAAPELSAHDYIREHLHSRPAGTLDTFVIGLTQYPFANKWDGFEPWSPRLGSILAVSSLVGLFLFLGLPRGRLLLVVLLSSLVPYAVTWRLIADWRFTEHAYPFLLVASCATPWFVVRAVERRGRVERSRLVIWTAAALVLGAGWFLFTRVTPPLVVEESLRVGEQATILAGDRDASFFTADWPAVVKTGTITTRVSQGARASITLPLPVQAEYDLLLRVDPSTAPLRAGVGPQPIQFLINGRLAATCDPGSSPERVGVCRLTLPADAVRAGANRLTLVTDQPSGFRVWYVRIVPHR